MPAGLVATVGVAAMQVDMVGSEDDTAMVAGEMAVAGRLGLAASQVKVADWVLWP